LLTQGKDDNEAGRKKDKQETANLSDREYKRGLQVVNSLEFSKITLDCIGALRPFFADNKCRICDGTVGGTFMWRDLHNTEYVIEDEVLYLKVTHPQVAFAPPRGAVIGKKPYEKIIEYCSDNGIIARICSVSEAILGEILDMFPDAKSFSDRAWSDYLYLSESIATLAGRRLAGQRNHINRFVKEHPDWSFERITGSNLGDVRAFFERYASEHIKDYPAYMEGNSKALEVLDNLDVYGQFGGALYADGKVIGASLGETAGDTLYIHIEKADADFHGSYPMLMQQFAVMFVSDGTVYINREEDDGVEGLRTSKLSYHPVALLDKYVAEID
jgi:hypothetical protein